MLKSNKKVVFLFLSPAIGAILIFFFIPVLAAIVISFTDFDIYGLADFSKVRFVGFKNYIVLINDPVFWQALKNTFYYVLVAGPLSVIVSLFAAILLNNKVVKFKALFRLTYFIPVITTLVAVAIVWRFIYHPHFGLFNYFLSFLGIDPIDWLGDPFWAMPALIIMSVWKVFGYNMIIFIAGLQNIPQQLYEAAEIEGATRWQAFRNITLPMLTPTTLFVSLITIIGMFQIFAEPYVMTNGGPLNKTLSIVLYMYENGFRWWNMGYSAAIAFLLFVIILIFTIIQFKIYKPENENVL